jgi:glycosyltransferase involved in cell wall biosynthesis
MVTAPPASFSVRLLEGPPRLRALAAARLGDLGARVDETDRPPGEIVAWIDPHAVVDPDALRAAAEQARAADRAQVYPARHLDGSIGGAAVTLLPGGRDDDHPVACSEPVGTWLPDPDPCRIPEGPTTAAIYGIFLEPTGYANVGRSLLAGLAARGLAVTARRPWWPENGDAGVRPEERALVDAALRREAPTDVPSVLLRPAGDASGTPSYSEYAATRLRGAVCALTMFESDDVPARWIRSLRECDQVWVPSSFNVETFASAGIERERLRLVPIGIDAPQFAPDGPRLQLPNRRRTAFLSVFDWNERKGPDVLLRAWSRAFGPDDDVVLYVRTGSSSVGARGGLLEQIRIWGLDLGRMAPIEVLDTPLPVDAYTALFRSVDAFVLTSRGEAFCIPMLEAMAAGVPAIGTGYGGSADFLDETTGFPIPARLVPVGRELAGRVPFYAGQRWADPSVDATIAALRRIVDEPAETTRRAAHAFARAHLVFDRRVTSGAAERALAQARPHRTVHSAARSVLAAPIFAGDRSGNAARRLFDALETTGATPRLERLGDRSADLDPVQTRHLRRALRLTPAPDETGLAVDLVRRDTRALFLTNAPDDVSALAAIERIWTDDPLVARTLRSRGVPGSRIITLRLPVDVTLWTPDARGPSLAERTVLVAPEPQRVDALAAFARMVTPADDVVLLLAPPAGGSLSAPELTAELARAMEQAGVAAWRPRVLALPAPLAAREVIAALAPTTLALAADPAWPDHEFVRACGVPVLTCDELEGARTLLGDIVARDAEGLRTRRAAVARARADATAIRVAFDEAVPLLSVERPLRPLRIVAVPAAGLPDAARVVDGLRRTALHTIVGVDGDLREVDYVVRVERAVETADGWDELLVNALEARSAVVVESVDWETISPNLPASSFDELRESAMLARNCEAGAFVPSASGALQLVRAVDATATGPAWRCVGCTVRALVSAAPR